MALRFLLDENLRGALWHAIQHHNSLGVDVLDALRVGDTPAPPTGTADPDLLLWCEANGCLLVSEDRKTMPEHLNDHFLAGRHVAGVFLLRPGWSVALVLAFLILADQTSDPAVMVDHVEYVP